MTRKTAERISLDQKALDVLDGANFYFLNDGDIARELDTHPTNVARARALGYVSPALLWALVDADYLDRAEVAKVIPVAVQPCAECGEAHTKKTCSYNRKRRDRGRTFAARVPDDLFDEITAEARRLEITNGEMAAHMWECWKQTVWRVELDSLADAGAEDDDG